MEENKKEKRPIILSMPVIIFVSICSLTMLAPVSIIMSLIRFKKYPDRKDKNITCLGISIVMMIALIMFLSMPDTGNTDADNTEVVKVEETVEETTEPETEVEETTVETTVEETTVEETTESASEETVEDTGIYGYPAQEKELTDAGVDISTIMSRECFLYTYAEYKLLADKADLKTMDDIEKAIWDYITGDTESMADYEIIDGMTFSYRGDNLFDYIADYLVPLVGDEWQDVVNVASETYFGYSLIETVGNSDSTTNSNSVTIDYIEALDGDSFRLEVSNYGSKTKEEIYDAASEVASNINTVQFNNYSKDFVRNVDANVGQPIVYSGLVTSTIDNYAELLFTPDTIYDDREVSSVNIDLSYLQDTTLFVRDNVTVYGVYLGLDSRNEAIILALSISIN